MSEAIIEHALALLQPEAEATAAVQAAALSSICELSPEDLDNNSFDLFDAAMCHIGHPAAKKLVIQLATAASAREVFCMVMEAFGKHSRPSVQLLLLQALATVLPRLRRKRAEFIETCLRSLTMRFLDEWPGEEWDDCDEGDDIDEGNESISPPTHASVAIAAASATNESLSGQPSYGLLGALTGCIESLTHPSAAQVAAVPGEAVEMMAAATVSARPIVLGFLFRLLEVAISCGLSMDSPLAERMDLCIRQYAPTMAEVVARIEDAESAASSGLKVTTGVAAADKGGCAAEVAEAGTVESVGSTSDVAAELLVKWSLLGIGHHLRVQCARMDAAGIPPRATTATASATAGAHQPDADAHPTPTPAREDANLVTELKELPPTRRIVLLSRLAVVMLPHGVHGAAGHALLSWSTRGVGRAALTAAEDRACVGGAVRALLGHMAGSADQSERTAAYKTLQVVVWLWPAAERLALLRSLLLRCPFPNVVALLVHRLKEEHLAEAHLLCSRGATAVKEECPREAQQPSACGSERKGSGKGNDSQGDGDAASAASAAVDGTVFSASRLLSLVEPLMTVPHADGGSLPDPLDSIDAVRACCGPACKSLHLLPCISSSFPPRAASASVYSLFDCPRPLRPLTNPLHGR